MATKKSDKELVEKMADMAEKGDLSAFGEQAVSLFCEEKPIYKVVTFSGDLLFGLNLELEKFDGTIVEVISYREVYGVYELVALCYI